MWFVLYVWQVSVLLFIISTQGRNSFSDYCRKQLIHILVCFIVVIQMDFTFNHKPRGCYVHYDIPSKNVYSDLLLDYEVAEDPRMNRDTDNLNDINEARYEMIRSMLDRGVVEEVPDVPEKVEEKEREEKVEHVEEICDCEGRGCSGCRYTTQRNTPIPPDPSVCECPVCVNRRQVEHYFDFSRYYIADADPIIQNPPGGPVIGDDELIVTSNTIYHNGTQVQVEDVSEIPDEEMPELVELPTRVFPPVERMSDVRTMDSLARRRTRQVEVSIPNTGVDNSFDDDISDQLSRVNYSILEGRELSYLYMNMDSIARRRFNNAYSEDPRRNYNGPRHLDHFAYRAGARICSGVCRYCFIVMAIITLCLPGSNAFSLDAQMSEELSFSLRVGLGLIVVLILWYSREYFILFLRCRFWALVAPSMIGGVNAAVHDVSVQLPSFLLLVGFLAYLRTIYKMFQESNKPKLEGVRERVLSWFDSVCVVLVPWLMASYGFKSVKVFREIFSWVSMLTSLVSGCCNISSGQLSGAYEYIMLRLETIFLTQEERMKASQERWLPWVRSLKKEESAVVYDAIEGMWDTIEMPEQDRLSGRGGLGSSNSAVSSRRPAGWIDFLKSKLKKNSRACVLFVFSVIIIIVIVIIYFYMCRISELSARKVKFNTKEEERITMGEAKLELAKREAGKNRNRSGTKARKALTKKFGKDWVYYDKDGHAITYDDLHPEEKYGFEEVEYAYDHEFDDVVTEDPYLDSHLFEDEEKVFQDDAEGPQSRLSSRKEGIVTKQGVINVMDTHLTCAQCLYIKACNKDVYICDNECKCEKKHEPVLKPVDHECGGVCGIQGCKHLVGCTDDSHLIFTRNYGHYLDSECYNLYYAAIRHHNGWFSHPGDQTCGPLHEIVGIDGTGLLVTPNGSKYYSLESKRKKKTEPPEKVVDPKDTYIQELQKAINESSKKGLEKSTTICWAFKNGKCSRGENCRFSHTVPKEKKAKKETKELKPKKEAVQLGNHIFDVDTPKKSLFVIKTKEGSKIIHGHCVNGWLRIPLHGIDDNSLDEFIVSFPLTGWEMDIRKDNKLVRIVDYKGAEIWRDKLLTIHPDALKGCQGLKSIKFRPPVDGEQVAVVANSFEPGRSNFTVSVGTVKMQGEIGTYDCSTMEGHCGALVVAGDGKCVGYHIAGSTGRNYFVPIAPVVKPETVKLKTSHSVEAPKNRIGSAVVP